jgi:hypothetical protein
MKRKAWREAIHELPVFDTHTHLNRPGVPIAAQTVWDIAHYFWFQQELWSVGYPVDAANLPEAQRRAAFAQAFNAVRNTNWHLIVRRICTDLYDTPLTDGAGHCTPERVEAVDAAVRERGQQPGWARAVIDRLGIRRIAVNVLAEASLPDLPGVGVAVPTGGDQGLWRARIVAADDPRAELEVARRAIREEVAEMRALGLCGMRIDAEAFETDGKAAVSVLETFPVDKATEWQADAALSQLRLEALSEAGMFAQLFLGIQRDVSPRTSMAVNDPRRVTNLYPLFERYTCGFELVIGAPQNNMDAAQAARIYPNVHLGGLWWYNFRASTYRQAMQMRAEAVPASKSALVASDARCIEWCYIKILLIKKTMAGFLYRQIEEGWLDEDAALYTARCWLHDTAKQLYVRD